MGSIPRGGDRDGTRSCRIRHPRLRRAGEQHDPPARRRDRAGAGHRAADSLSRADTASDRARRVLPRHGQHVRHERRLSPPRAMWRAPVRAALARPRRHLGHDRGHVHPDVPHPVSRQDPLVAPRPRLGSGHLRPGPQERLLRRRARMAKPRLLLQPRLVHRPIHLAPHALQAAHLAPLRRRRRGLHRGRDR